VKNYRKIDAKIDRDFRYNVIDTRAGNQIAGVYRDLDKAVHHFRHYLFDFPGRYVLIDTKEDMVLEVGMKYLESDESTKTN